MGAPGKGQHAETSTKPAFRSPSAVALFLAAAAAGLAADLISKQLVFEGLLAEADLPNLVDRLRRAPGGDDPRRIIHHPELRAYTQRPVCPGVRLTLSINPGVVFGLALHRYVVAVATVVAVALVGFFFATARASDRWLHLPLAAILGGALGNLYDRLFAEVRLPGMEPIRHHVRDFIDCSGLYYPYVFNVADVLLVVGVVVLALRWLLVGKGPRKSR